MDVYKHIYVSVYIRGIYMSVCFPRAVMVAATELSVPHEVRYICMHMYIEMYFHIYISIYIRGVHIYLSIYMCGIPCAASRAR